MHWQESFASTISSNANQWFCRDLNRLKTVLLVQLN
jgi:hypothetical protein